MEAKLFWDENRAFPELHQRGHCKRVVPLPTPTQARREKARELLKETAGELCALIRSARAEQGKPFTCRIENFAGGLRCRTNGLYHVLLVAPITARTQKSALFPCFKAELNTDFWISSLFGRDIDAFNAYVNTLPQEARLDEIVRNVTGHLPSPKIKPRTSP